MLYVHNTSTNAFFNAALEQYLLHAFDDDIFMLWQNKNAVVIGKHQVAYKEVNFPYIIENNIDVARRITGGGTVYHDLGNVNFTFIERIEDKTKLIDFKRYLTPMQIALKRMGIDVVITSANDLTLEGKKVSGNAEHVFSQKKKVIHHGTLLFNSELGTLGNAIRQGTGQFESKGVNSNRSIVSNIGSSIGGTVSVETFMEELKMEILRDKSYSEHHLTKEDVEAIEVLKNEKFETWEWNYGYSPAYTFRRSNLFSSEGLNCSISVKNGKILLALFGREKELKEFKNFHGLRHKTEDLQSLLPELSQFLGVNPDHIDLVQLMH
jgi:lipoate---protein ligase